MKRILLKWGLRVGAVLLTLAALLLGALVLFEQRWGAVVLRKGIEAINTQLRVPVSTRDVSFTFFSNFPHASLHLRDVFIPSTDPEGSARGDTLLLAKSVYLVLNPFHLLRGKYRIERCRIVQGFLYLKHGASGIKNYDLFQSRESDTTSTASDVHLQSILLEQIAVDFVDVQNQVHAAALISDLKVSGNIASKSYQLDIKGSGLVETLRQGDFLYAQRQHFELRSQILSENAVLRTPHTHLTLDRNKFDIEGYLDQNTGQADLKATGSDIDLRSLLAFASQFQWQPPAAMDVKGMLGANLTITGSVHKGGKLLVDMGLAGKDLTLKYYDQAYTIREITGRFTNGKHASPSSTTFELSRCLITHRNSHIDVAFNLTNLRQPTFYAKVNVALHNDEILPEPARAYVGHYASITASGEMLASLRSTNPISIASLVNPRANLQLAFSDLTLMPRPDVTLTHLEGAATLIENDLAKGALSGTWDDTQFSLGVNIKSMLSLFVPHRNAAQWTVNASATNTTFEHIAALFTPSDSLASDSTRHTLRPFWDGTQSVMGSLSLENCKYKDLKIDALSSQFTLTKDETFLQLDDASLLNGRLHGQLTFKRIEPHRTTLTAELYPKEIDLKRLFADLNNFDQKVITSQNIEGTLTGGVSLYAPMEHWKIIPADLQMQAQITVQKGVLTDMKSLDQLANFISLDELKRIRFSTLTNTISIRNQRVAIPQMRINSSALNLSLSGEHHFNSTYQYHIALGLSDLLFNRLRTRKRDIDENAVAESEGEKKLSLFLVLEGDGNHCNVRFDQQALRTRLNEKIQHEKETLRNMLNEEFNMGTSTPPSDKPSTPPSGYTIEWAEDSIPKSPKPPRQKPKDPNKPPVRITWDDD